MLCWFSTTRQLSYNYTYPHPLELPSSPTIPSLQISQCDIATSPSLSILAMSVCVNATLSVPPTLSFPDCVHKFSLRTCKYISIVCYLLRCVQFFATLWTVVHQAPLSMEFCRQEHWSQLLFPSPGDLTQGSNPVLLNCRQILSAELPGEHLHSFLENRFINIIFFQIHIYVLIYNICFSVSDLLHSV